MRSTVVPNKTVRAEQDRTRPLFRNLKGVILCIFLRPFLFPLQVPLLNHPWCMPGHVIHKHYTLKLGLYVHGLVYTLGYNVLSVDHGHCQSENMFIFSDKTYRTWHKIGYYVPSFRPEALSCPFVGSFF